MDMALITQPWLKPLRYTLRKLGSAWAHAH